MSDPSPLIPVTLLTGFLGSGKTTVLNHVLKHMEMAATAVIVNEFGEIGIDRLLLTKCDLAEPEIRRTLEARLVLLNPSAPVIDVVDGAVDPSLLFNLGLFDPEKKTIDVQRWLHEEAFLNDHVDNHGHHHDV